MLAMPASACHAVIGTLRCMLELMEHRPEDIPRYIALLRDTADNFETLVNMMGDE